MLGERRGTELVTLYEAPARAAWLGGLPPLFISMASAEVFRDEDVAFRRLVAANKAADRSLSLALLTGHECVVDGMLLLGRRIMADCGSLDDAKAAQDAGADILGTTLAGYTGERPKTDEPDLELFDQVAGVAEVPLVVEGRVHTPAQAAAMEHGAFAVGTALTHPTTITSWFASALPSALWKS